MSNYTEFGIGSTVSVGESTAIHKVVAFRETVTGIMPQNRFFEYQVKPITGESDGSWLTEKDLTRIPYGPSYWLGDVFGDRVLTSVFLSVVDGWEYGLRNTTGNVVYLKQKEMTALAESFQE